MNRISEGKERNEGMILAKSMKRARPPVSLDGLLATGEIKNENLYTGKDFEDDFKPPTPRGWNM